MADSSEPDISWAKDEENAALTSSDATAGEDGVSSDTAVGGDNDGGSSSWSDPATDSTKVFNPSAKRSCAHRIFRFVKFMTVLSAFMLCIGQIVAVFNGRASNIQIVLKLYIMAFCALVVLTEMEWTKIARDSKLLTNWIGRGFAYSFVGLVSVEENDVMTKFVDVSLAGRTQMMFIEVVSYFMVAVGINYFLLGLACCQIVSDRARADYTKRRNGEAA